MGTGTAGRPRRLHGRAAQGGPAALLERALRGCPEGQTPALHLPDCCACVPLDKNIMDCSNVRCAACPEGQHPALVPPDCCRCIPD